MNSEKRPSLPGQLIGASIAPMLLLCGLLLWLVFVRRSSGQAPSDNVVIYSTVIAYLTSGLLLLAGCISLYRLRLVVKPDGLSKADLLLLVATLALIAPWLLIDALAAQ